LGISLAFSAEPKKLFVKVYIRFLLYLGMKKAARKKHPARIKKKHQAKARRTIRAGKIFEKRVGSGIPNFDGLIEGGFEKNSINIAAGSAGSGKSIFAMQFLIEGLKKGEKCLYVSFEEQKEHFYNNMLDFGWDLKGSEEKGDFSFLQYTPEKVRLMLEEGGGSIESAVLTKKISRIVIDSLTSFALLFNDELEKRQSILNLFNMIKDWGCTCVATLDENSSAKGRVLSSNFDIESDSIIVLYYLRRGERRERFLEVLKMRGTKHSSKIYPLEFTSRGLVVHKNALSDQVAFKLGL
jgi:circadian clock protein KaiC